jgi:hypothetical protein
MQESSLADHRGLSHVGEVDIAEIRLRCILFSPYCRHHGDQVVKSTSCQGNLIRIHFPAGSPWHETAHTAGSNRRGSRHQGAQRKAREAASIDPQRVVRGTKCCALLCESNLLLTDSVMPDVNGRQLGDEVQRNDLALKVLFTFRLYQQCHRAQWRAGRWCAIDLQTIHPGATRQQDAGVFDAPRQFH